MAKALKAKAVKVAKKGATTKTATRQRAIQNVIDKKDAKSRKPAKKMPAKKAVQAGARKQPTKLPAQHVAKPGKEADLKLQPQFVAPSYRGSGKLEGMKAIVTGADSGIGRAVAVLFAREGADVAIFYLNEHEDAKKTAWWIENEGRKALLVPGDVRDSKFCKKAVDKVVKEFGGLDILVNNAAFQQHAEEIGDLTDKHIMETLETNIAGYFYMARAALEHMEKGASIINTGSQTGLFGSPELLDYSATKGAVHAFTKALATNLLEREIRVNCVAPGPVWTPFNPADRPAKDVKEFGMQSAMGRPAQPEELSPAYVFLASPVMSSYINGVILPVIGGPKG